jgi:hypothetical protein
MRFGPGGLEALEVQLASATGLLTSMQAQKRADRAPCFRARRVRCPRLAAAQAVSLLFFKPWHKAKISMKRKSQRESLRLLGLGYGLIRTQNQPDGSKPLLVAAHNFGCMNMARLRSQVRHSTTFRPPTPRMPAA